MTVPTGPVFLHRTAELSDTLLPARKQCRRRQHAGRFGVCDDGTEPSRRCEIRGGQRRRNRHGDHPGCQAPEERGDELESRRKEEKRAVARGGPRLQVRPDRQAPLVEFAPRDALGFDLPVTQERVCEFGSLAGRAPIEQVNERAARERQAAGRSRRTRAAERTRPQRCTAPSSTTML